MSMVFSHESFRTAIEEEKVKLFIVLLAIGKINSVLYTN